MQKGHIQPCQEVIFLQKCRIRISIRQRSVWQKEYYFFIKTFHISYICIIFVPIMLIDCTANQSQLRQHVGLMLKTFFSDRQYFEVLS